MKKLFAICVAILFALSFTVGAFAADKAVDAKADTKKVAVEKDKKATDGKDAKVEKKKAKKDKKAKKTKKAKKGGKKAKKAPEAKK